MTIAKLQTRKEISATRSSGKHYATASIANVPATDAIEHIVAEGKVWFIRQPFGFVCGISHLHQGGQLIRLINDGAQDPHISQQLGKHNVAKWPECASRCQACFMA